MDKYIGIFLQNPLLTLSGLTALYVFLTFLILIHMRKEREDLRRPYIQINSYARERSLECLLIKNVGQTAAEDVRFLLDKDFFQYGKPERNIREFPLFTSGIKSIPPNNEYHIGLAQYQLFFSEDRDENIIPTSFSITCTYSYKTYLFKKKKIKEKTTIDVEATRKTLLPSRDLPLELKELNKELSKKLSELISLLKRSQRS